MKRKRLMLYVLSFFRPPDYLESWREFHVVEFVLCSLAGVNIFTVNFKIVFLEIVFIGFLTCYVYLP